MKKITVTFIKQRTMKIVTEGLTSVNSLVIKNALGLKNFVAVSTIKSIEETLNKLGIKIKTTIQTIRGISVINKVDIKNIVHFSTIRKAETPTHRIVYMSNVVPSKISKVSFMKHVIQIASSVNLSKFILLKNLFNKFEIKSKVSFIRLRGFNAETNKMQLNNTATLSTRKKLTPQSISKIKINSNVSLHKKSKITVYNSMVFVSKPLSTSIYTLSKLKDFSSTTIGTMGNKTLGELLGVEK